jgi:hypothetical protein
MGAHRTLEKPIGWRTLQPLKWPELQGVIRELLGA